MPGTSANAVIKSLETFRARFESDIEVSLSPNKFTTFCALLKEDTTKAQSKQSRSRRSHAQDILKQVVASFDPEVLVAIAFTTSVSTLGQLKSDELLSDIRARWKSHSHPGKLHVAAKKLFDNAAPDVLPGRHILDLSMPGKGGYCEFSFTSRYMIEALPEPIRTMVKNSKSWAMEDASGGLAVTNCVSLHLPRKVNEDALMTLKIGYIDGFHMSTLLGMGDPHVVPASNSD